MQIVLSTILMFMPDTKMEKSSYMKLVEMQVVQVTEKLAAAHFLLDSIIT